MIRGEERGVLLSARSATRRASLLSSFFFFCHAAAGWFPAPTPFAATIFVERFDERKVRAPTLSRQALVQEPEERQSALPRLPLSIIRQRATLVARRCRLFSHAPFSSASPRFAFYVARFDGARSRRHYATPRPRLPPPHPEPPRPPRLPRPPTTLCLLC